MHETKFPASQLVALLLLVPLAAEITSAALAQDFPHWQVPKNSVLCMQDHAEAYLSLDSEVNVVFPNICPDLKISDSLHGTENSDKTCTLCPSAGALALVLTRPDLACLLSLPLPQKDLLVIPKSDICRIGIR